MELKNQWRTKAELKALARQILRKLPQPQNKEDLDQYARDCVF